MASDIFLLKTRYKRIIKTLPKFKTLNSFIRRLSLLSYFIYWRGVATPAGSAQERPLAVLGGTIMWCWVSNNLRSLLSGLTLSFSLSLFIYMLEFLIFHVNYHREVYPCYLVCFKLMSVLNFYRQLENAE